jgi:hypothetical protein
MEMAYVGGMAGWIHQGGPSRYVGGMAGWIHQGGPSRYVGGMAGWIHQGEPSRYVGGMAGWVSRQAAASAAPEPRYVWWSFRSPATVVSVGGWSFPASFEQAGEPDDDR